MSIAFQRQGARIAKAAERGLYRTASVIISDSIQLVPYETGTLRASARVEMPTRSGGRIEVRAGYGYGAENVNPLTGQPASAYAIPVHERLDVVHPHGQAHFLLDAALAHIHELAPNVAAEIIRGRTALGGGVEVYEQVLAEGE